MNEHEQEASRRSVFDVTPKERQTLFAALETYTRQQSKRDQAGRWKLTVILVLVATYVVFNVGVLFYDPEAPSGTDYVSVVRMDGEIGPTSMVSAARYATPLRAAFSDEHAKGVVLVINSRGGTPAQSQLIYEMIERYETEFGKRSIVVAEDYLTSGAYMIAVAGDKIYAPSTAFIGSIGVVAPGVDLSELGERYGIKDQTFTAGKSKAPYSMWKPPSDEDRAKITEYLSDIHEEFIAIVRRGRGERLVEDADLFTGEIWTGLRARSLGLIDDHLDFEQAIRAEFGVEQTKIFKPKLGANDLFSLLLGG